MTGLFGPDAAMPAIVLRTLAVSGAAATMAVLVGVPAGYVIARRSFRGRTLLLGLVNTGMGMPPVVVGLVVWVMLVRSGPFGDLGLIYTQSAMVVAQFMSVGRGHLEFSMTVDRVVDLVEGVGRIEDVRVRIRWAGTDPQPRPGDRVTVHAARFCELEAIS